MSLIDLSTVAGGEEDFGKYIGQVCDQLDLDYASYAALNPTTHGVQGYANYPDAWKKHYAKHGYHLFDPTLHASARSIAPVDWSRFRRDDKFHTVFRPAREYGIGPNGVTVPVRGPFGDCGLLSVTKGGDPEAWNRHRAGIIGDLQRAAVHMHDAIMRSDRLYSMLRMPGLSSREREILQWSASGKTQHDIGDILSISSRTVEVHLRSAREKLGALTTTQAVARALAFGMIQPD